MLNSKIKEKITCSSISLEKFGVKDFGWTKENAKIFINSIFNDNIGILGGDVYVLSNHSLKPLYDNWFCEQFNTETKEEFFLRSKYESLNYVESYPVKPGEKIIFSLTFTEQLN